VLTGAGGDQWMCGRVGYFGDERRAGRYGSLLRNVVEGGGRRLTALALMSLVHRGRAWSAQLFPHTRAVREPDWLGDELRGRLLPPGDPPAAPPMLGDVPRATLQRYATLHNPWEPYSYDALEPAVGGAHLVLAEPFYDTRVVNLAFAIPDSQRWHGADDRWLQRRALGPLLPPSVANRRSKAEFTPPFVAQLQRLGSDEHVSLRRLAERGWIDPDVAHHLTDRTRFGSAGMTPRKLWRLTAIEAWVEAVWN
jgi:hypothetical protein